jgi:hypothetical protein
VSHQKVANDLHAFQNCLESLQHPEAMSWQFQENFCASSVAIWSSSNVATFFSNLEKNSDNTDIT